MKSLGLSSDGWIDAKPHLEFVAVDIGDALRHHDVPAANVLSQCPGESSGHDPLRVVYFDQVLGGLRRFAKSHAAIGDDQRAILKRTGVL